LRKTNCLHPPGDVLFFNTVKGGLLATVGVAEGKAKEDGGERDVGRGTRYYLARGLGPPQRE